MSSAALRLHPHRNRPGFFALTIRRLLAASGALALPIVAAGAEPTLACYLATRSIFLQEDSPAVREIEARFIVLLYADAPLSGLQASLLVGSTSHPLSSAYNLAPWGIPNPIITSPVPLAGSLPALDRRFASATELHAVFPALGGATFRAVSFRGVINRPLPLPPLRPATVLAPIQNLAALQAWEGGPLTVTWRVRGVEPDEPDPGEEPRQSYATTRFLLSLHRTSTALGVEDSNRIGAVELGGTSYTFSQVAAEPGETLFGELTAHPSRFWSVRFPIRRANPAAPVITAQPRAVAVRVGDDATFSVTTLGSGLSYQWRKDSVSLPGATEATLTLRAVRADQAGEYAVRVAGPGGEVVSTAATLTVVVPPAITAEPRGQTVLTGAAASFAVTATGTGLTYQWQRNGEPLAGATQATFTLAAARLADAGSYRVTIANAAGAVTSAAVELDVAPITRLANLSVRARLGEDAPLTVGLTVSGGTAGATKPLLLRAVGPSLAAFGVGDAATAVQLALLHGAETIAANDGWRGQAALATTASAVGAFALAGPTSLDAALLQPVPGAGYTARITAAAPGGTALAEIYDASPNDTFNTATPRLTNLSVLTHVGGGADVLIAGFTVVGRHPQRLLVRAVGPALAAFGVADFLSDPRLELHRAGTATAIAANDDWGSAASADAARAAADVGAFALPPDGRDAVLLVTLPPGSYTAQVGGPGEARGIALVEVYEVP